MFSAYDDPVWQWSPSSTGQSAAVAQRSGLLLVKNQRACTKTTEVSF
jgi:hypothetical protein